MRLPDPNLPWPIPLAAVGIIAEREGCRLRTYKCPAGVWTIGWGETDPEKARPGATCTQQQADRWLLEDLQRRAVRVQTMLTVHAEPNQLGALVSLAYNIGIEALARSTVIKRHNAGDPEAAARAFGLWNQARVKGQLQVLPGLTARRAAEAALYLTPEPDAPRERMPQAVAAESSIAASPIAQGGAVTVGTGALALLQEAGAQATPVGDALGKVKEIVVGTLGVPADLFLPVVLLAAGAAVLYWRWKQRSGGWC